MNAKNIFVVCAIIVFTTLQSRSSSLNLVKINSIIYIEYHYEFHEEVAEYPSQLPLPVPVHDAKIINDFKNSFMSLELNSNQIYLKIPSFESTRKSKTFDSEAFQIIQLPFNQK